MNVRCQRESGCYIKKDGKKCTLDFIYVRDGQDDQQWNSENGCPTVGDLSPYQQDGSTLPNSTLWCPDLRGVRYEYDNE